MASDHNHFVYIVSNNTRSTLYIGMTDNLERRMWEHRNPTQRTFTQAYHCTALLYYAQFPDVHAAIAWEKKMKGWVRRKKVALIAQDNPRFEDLAAEWAR